MEAVATRPANTSEPVIPQYTWRAIAPLRGRRLRRLLRAALQAVNVSPRDVPAEFYRLPFP